MRVFIGIAAAIMVHASVPARAESLDSVRARKIVKAFDQHPGDLVEPLTVEQVKIQDGQGRVDVNTKTKFSYFIQTLDPRNPESPILLMPMATSRYTPTYYQTDEWWDAHKQEIEQAKREGRPAPRQDMDEVAAWLKANKLSTNPLVLEIRPMGIKQTRLQDYLRDFILEHHSRDGYVTLYRGGEKPGEIDGWLKGEKPRGVRYWTPTANYAWRYARKNKRFLDELIDGRAPLFVFKLPVERFVEMTERNWPQLTLGTELTRNAHTAFERGGVFIDHLYQMEYAGQGTLGVEVELRSNRKGAERMVEAFERAITIEDLAKDRIDVLKKANARLKQQYPKRASALDAKTADRVERILAEARLLIAVREKMPREVVEQLLRKLPPTREELAYIDGVHFEALIRERMQKLPRRPTASVDVRSEIDVRFGLTAPSPAACKVAFP